MKTCPYCAEEIQDAAIKCKHCGEFLEGSRPAVGPAKHPLPWIFRTSTLIMAICCVGPLALPIILWRPGWTLQRKIILSVLIISVSLVMFWLMKKSIEGLSEVYRQLDDVLNGKF